MKFMTKEEYQRKIDTRANSLASTSYAMRKRKQSILY